jgi:glucose dehydrogenase
MVRLVHNVGRFYYEIKSLKTVMNFIRIYNFKQSDLFVYITFVPDVSQSIYAIFQAKIDFFKISYI